MDLRPQIEAPCVACGDKSFDIACSADRIAAQQRFLIQFHRRRLRSHAPESALDERAHFSQDYPTSIARCTRCGLLSRNPRPAAIDIENAYRSDTYGDEKLHALFESQLPEALKLARWLRPYLRRGSRIVEVGSFVGCFLKAAANMGWAAEGVDPGDEVTNFSRRRGLRVHKGALDDAEIAPRSVDAVVVWNTFDQLPDPQCLLRTAKSLLKPNGIVALRVPNGDAFPWWLSLEEHGLIAVREAALEVLAWNNLLTFPYLHGYGVDSLDRLMSDYGFARIRASGDTLCRLSDADTRGWAVVEEWALKSLATASARVENLRPWNPLHVPPWLNLCYRNRFA